VTIALVSSLCVETGCTEIGRGAFDKAIAISRGASEAKLLNTAGPPTRKVTLVDGRCRDQGGVYEFVYEVKFHYFGNWHTDSPSSSVAFCIDSSSRVVEIDVTEY
jgi:hypothetical protein